jgi:hypothetical protein
MATSTEGSVAAWQVEFEVDGDESLHAAISIRLAGPPTHHEARQKALKILQGFLNDACEAVKKIPIVKLEHYPRCSTVSNPRTVLSLIAGGPIRRHQWPAFAERLLIGCQSRSSRSATEVARGPRRAAGTAIPSLRAVKHPILRLETDQNFEPCQSCTCSLLYCVAIHCSSQRTCCCHSDRNDFANAYAYRLQ